MPPDYVKGISSLFMPVYKKKKKKKITFPLSTFALTTRFSNKIEDHQNSLMTWSFSNYCILFIIFIKASHHHKIKSKPI